MIDEEDGAKGKQDDASERSEIDAKDPAAGRLGRTH
mgnify:CR=1 FL=1